ncbi:hypothetical protein U9M48_041850 [Paspalum notatum var. saurae]|uniref:BHLH domain-containing protein n=1 Tax=Paspalum notatum var. saurae TaxID=547442 RepID=A0AAQ3UQ69_PASNO
MLLHHDDAGPPLGLPAHDDDGDDDAVPPWLHCPVVGDADADDTAPLPPEYCAGLLPAEYSAAAPPEPAKQAAPPAPAPAEGVMNFTFFSRPLQRPPASHSHPVRESTAVQAAAATNRLRSTPLFSEQRMAWLQPPKAPRAAAVVAPPPPPPTQAPLAPPPDGRCRGAVKEAGTVTPTPHGMQQPEAAAAPDAVTTSSVCSGNGDRSHANKRSGGSLHHQHHADCSVSLSQDELDLDVDDEGGATRRSSAAARSSKRSRTAEVHNLSERRRRDRINEKMRALQELIPNCNKIDKASMLEEAIEYLKTLQLQVQMMSMGSAGLCVPPMLLPAAAMAALPHPHPMAQYAHFPHHMAMGLGFGAFDMLPLQLARGVPAHFPCPPMAMPAPGPMFGVPSPAAMFAHAAAPAAGTGAGTAPPEQVEAAAAAPAPARSGAEQPPVPAAAQET